MRKIIMYEGYSKIDVSQFIINAGYIIDDLLKKVDIEDVKVRIYDTPNGVEICIFNGDKAIKDEIYIGHKRLDGSGDIKC